MALTEFLLARIAEDEERARVGAFYPEEHTGWLGARRGGSYVGFTDRFNPARVLAECEAKRRIVDLAQRLGDPEGLLDRLTFPTARAGVAAALRVLASVYADHPDYDQEWKP